ncbi:hypothetical protein VTO73DRAFT_1790 [Trametes versicolor]
MIKLWARLIYRYASNYTFVGGVGYRSQQRPQRQQRKNTASRSIHPPHKVHGPSVVLVPTFLVATIVGQRGEGAITPGGWKCLIV